MSHVLLLGNSVSKDITELELFHYLKLYNQHSTFVKISSSGS